MTFRSHFRLTRLQVFTISKPIKQISFTKLEQFRMVGSSISPYFRSPLTDLTGGLISHQLFGRCAKQEMDMSDCLEAYGLDRGLRKCRDLMEDFRECHTLTKQFNRFYAMRREREKQIAEGKLTGDDKYVSPRVDSF